MDPRMLMTILDTVLLATALVVCCYLFSKRLRTSRTWRATVTPLASIIGSGFLVVVPLLGHCLGDGAFLAIIVIVVVAYWVGEVIRFNITHLEPLLESQVDLDGAPSGDYSRVKSARLVAKLELLSNLALVLAYFVSVTFYLRLLSAFVLRGLGWHDDWIANVLTSFLLLFIGLVGKYRGLAGLERLEQYSVSVKLSIIAAMLVGWSALAYQELSQPGGLVTVEASTHGFGALRTVAGTFLVVQGFETSRYLGAEYDAATRVRTMRTAQILAGLIYITFVGLSVPAMHLIPDHVDETAIISFAPHVAWIMAPMVILAATMSQFSAAVADTVGSGGLLSQNLGRRSLVSAGDAYVVVAGVGILLVWSTDVFAIITLASRAFAFYYGLQALGAAALAGSVLSGWRKRCIVTAFLTTALLMGLIVVFAIPAG